MIEEESRARVELLITKKDDVVRILLSRRWISFHQLNRDAIRNEEAFAEFSLIEKLNRLPWTRASKTHTCPDTLPTLPSHIGSGSSTLLYKHIEAMGQVKPAWHNVDGQKAFTRPYYQKKSTPRCLTR